MKLESKGAKIVEQPDIGVYVWLMPDGRWVGDDEDHWLSIPSKKGDLRRMRALADAVRSYGVEEGAPLFVASRQVTDEEYDEQVLRMMFGLTPDILDDVRNDNGRK